MGRLGPGLGGRAALAFCAAALTLPAAALAAFPGANPAESPRINTPNDPEFDRCEIDDEDTPGMDCQTYFEEDYRLFGFSPDTANTVPGAPPELHAATATQYADCSQLDAQGRAANVAAGDPQCAQIAGIRADTAWKYSTGDPDTVIAILDTGIRWQDRELLEQIHLNEAELPQPLATRATPLDGGPACGTFTAADDANGDGSFNVRDYACDPRVAANGGDTESDDLLDGSDLIAAFSDSSDADANGYIDDIAGWDFFDDDNDPFDASSCCSASGHGTGRGREAAARTDNGQGSPGICPDCQIMPLRIWDTFVVPTDFHSMAVVYAADNGASVVEGANGGITNTQFSRRAYEYADSKGVALTLVSSDINSANHNYPTNYNEAIYIAGALPDTAPFEACGGVGLPVVGDVVPIPESAAESCNQFFGFLGQVGLTPSAQPPTTSFFRNANLTQYGGKADVVLMGATGSENTGQASGAAGLLASYGREVFGDAAPLSNNEIRQLLTMTAEDVKPLNTGVLGQPDAASEGWDPHFGYGRVNLAAAMERIADERIPPEAQIDSPDWFTPINVDRVGPEGIAVRATAAAPHSDAGVGAWRLEYACGQDALDSEFEPVSSGTGPLDDDVVGTLSKALLDDLADTCDGSVGTDFGRPVGAASDGNAPGDPYPEPDPERHAFQIRFTVEEAGDPGNFGRYRKTLFAYRDDGNLPGWPKAIGDGAQPERHVTATGGEVPPRLYDLNGDNALDLVLATSSGEVHVLDSAGDPLPGWNGGQPVRTQTLAVAAAHSTPAGFDKPRETPRAPAIGDLDGDLEPDVVTTAGEHVYAWDRTGAPLPGYPVRIDPDLSEPCEAGAPKPCFDQADRAITEDNHIKRGFLGAPALADLDGDGGLDVVAGSLDQHVYAWDGQGAPLPGFPAKLASEGAPGAEIATSPAIADLDGEGPPEVILATNEVVPGDPGFPANPFDLFNAVLGSSTGSNPVYALHGDGTPVDGWPVPVGVAAGDLLPLVLPGHDAAVLDQDGDGDDEVVVSAATSLGLGGTRLVDGDGSTVRPFDSLAGDSLDPSPIVNLADYASVGALEGETPSVVKGGLSAAGAANLLAVNQNLPFAHVVQAWDPATGQGLPAYPRATDDFQLLGQPAIAKVDASGTNRAALYGTGLYQLHAYGPDGANAAGWPKFTGGWTQATPSAGDADGDGDLEVTTITREGWTFLWETDAPACDAGGTSTNEEWWTFHHDEHGTANYGHDARPPGTVGALAAGDVAPDGSVTLTWTEPGDDWLCGSADRFRVLLAEGPIERASDGEVGFVGDAAGAVGGAQQAVLDASTLGDATHAAVLYRDDAGNWGLARSVELPERGGPGPGPKRCTNRIAGSRDADRLRGTPAADRLIGKGGNDRLRGKRGDDCLVGGGDRDNHVGGAGDDTIRARGNARDVVSCGPGEDRAFVDRRDRVRGCETVRRKR
jgi:hypothetical protein